MTFDLQSITSTAATFAPQKILAYGVQGLGKTTFGCTFEKPILLRIEDGAAALDVPTFPKLIESYGELMEAMTALHNQEHDFKTLVLDSLDWLEPIVWAMTVSRINADRERHVESIEGVGYGKGYVEADADWRNVMGWLDALRLNRGMTIVLIAHAEVKNFSPPDGDPYDRYQIKLHKRAWALWQEWADMVLFANYRRRTIKTKDGGPKGESKFRADGTGERCLFTEERPAYLAKNRWGLPHEILIGQDKTWRAFHEALQQATGGRYQLPSNFNSKEAA
ncbi:MAG: ATP-binding protein [Desulfomicrobium sp.]